VFVTAISRFDEDKTPGPHVDVSIRPSSQDRVRPSASEKKRNDVYKSPCREAGHVVSHQQPTRDIAVPHMSFKRGTRRIRTVARPDDPSGGCPMSSHAKHLQPLGNAGLGCP
jgi:hypothetical protein